MKDMFFSIVIPAHNEQTTIEDTLQHLEKLSYPKCLYEVIVVENGSNDGTWELVKNFDTQLEYFKIYQSDKGVSKARNFGASKIADKSDWVIFLDADTILQPDFLNELKHFASQPLHKNRVIGTTEILPYKNNSRRAYWWFKVYDLGHRYTQTSYSIQICRTDVVKKIKYKDDLVLAEDLRYILDAKKYGKFFFLPTKNVFTSTRRFEQTGYWRLFFFWTFMGVMPKSFQQKVKYKVQR